MPSIQVTDHTFRRLQALAVPFVDSPEDVIVRLLDNPITPEEPKPPRARPAGTKEYDPFSPPPLTHTKLLRAVINGRSINPPRWNNLMDETLRECIRAGDAADVIRRSPVNVVLGHREDSGFRYLADVGISVQGQDAEGAWKGIVTLGAAFGFSIEAEFVWRPNKKAAFPGAGGVLRLSGR